MEKCKEIRKEYLKPIILTEEDQHGNTIVKFSLEEKENYTKVLIHFQTCKNCNNWRNKERENSKHLSKRDEKIFWIMLAKDNELKVTCKQFKKHMSNWDKNTAKEIENCFVDNHQFWCDNCRNWFSLKWILMNKK